MAGGPMTLVDYKEAVEPIMNDVFDGVYEQRRNEAKYIFKSVPGLKRSSHVETILFGFDRAQVIGDGEPVPYDKGGTQYSIFYPYDEIALGFGITQRAIEDSEHLDIASIYSRHLAQAVYETEEQLAANILNFGFNAAFTQQGGDGLPLFANNHPLAIGGTYSNILPSAELSMTSVEDMLIQIAQAVDARGKKIKLIGKQLVVPTALKFQAPVILKSILNPDATTASNQVNPLVTENELPDGFQVITRLSSPTAWFITTDLNAKGDKGLVRFNRREMKRGTNVDFNTNSIQNIASARFRYAWVDNRGISGNAGA